MNIKHKKTVYSFAVKANFLYFQYVSYSSNTLSMREIAILSAQFDKCNTSGEKNKTKQNKRMLKWIMELVMMHEQIKVVIREMC